MDEKTSALLEKLASKLGTTAEYLWAVLVKQARISATIDFVYIILITLAGVFLYKAHIKLSKKDKSGDSIYSEGEEMVIVPMLAAAVIFIFAAIWAFFSFGDIITAYFHPEFWALEQITKTFK
jgi:hypothetical protein